MSDPGAFPTVQLTGSRRDLEQVLAHVRVWIEPLAYAEAVRAFTVAVTAAAHVGLDEEVRIPLAAPQARLLIDWLVRQSERVARHGDTELAELLRRVARSGRRP